MKKYVRFIIAGAIVASVGLLIFLCALGAAGWNLSGVNNWEQDTFVTDESLEKVSIEIDAGKLVIKRDSIDGQAVVNFDYNDNYHPQIVVDGGTLRIASGQKQWHFTNYWYGDAPTIEVILNDEAFPKIELELNAGTVEFGDGQWGNYVSVELNAGAVTMGKVCVKQMFLDVNAGAFVAESITSEVFHCDVSAGAVDVKKLDSFTSSLDVSAGSATLKMVDPMAAYNVSVNKSAGSCNVTNQSFPDARRFLGIDISAGSVKITFDR